MKVLNFFVQHELKFKALAWLVVLLLLLLAVPAKAEQVQIGQPITLEVTATVVSIATIDPKYAENGEQAGWVVGGDAAGAEATEVCDTAGNCELLVVY